MRESEVIDLLVLPRPSSIVLDDVGHICIKKAISFIKITLSDIY